MGYATESYLAHQIKQQPKIMWLLTVFVSGVARNEKWLFDTEQHIKDYIRKNKFIQYNVEYIKIYHAD